jgi:type I restriction enzyme, S subunit
VNGTPAVRRLRLGDCLQEVNKGVGRAWQRYRLVGATRGGLAPAKEGVGKRPERYKLVEPGTIFYNPMRILLGSIALLDEGQEPGITSPDYVVFRTRPGLIHPRWFYYWLRSQDGSTFIRALARGAVRERMLFRRLAPAEIRVPPYESQLRFARTMELLGRARAGVEVQLEVAKGLSAALRRGAFRSSEVTRWPRKRLADLGPNDGAFTDGPFGSHLKTEHYSQYGARVIRLQNIRTGTFLAGC